VIALRAIASQPCNATRSSEMADFVFIVVVIVGFFALAWALVVGCDRIVGPDEDLSDLGPVSEVTR
jgi:hypothetical protein